MDLDRLFLIAENSSHLDKVEESLRENDYRVLADTLSKLQQDVGVEIDREMNGFDETEPAPGPISAALNLGFEPVTSERLRDVLQGAQKKLPEGSLRTDLGTFIAELNIFAIDMPANQASPPSHSEPS